MCPTTYMTTNNGETRTLVIDGIEFSVETQNGATDGVPCRTLKISYTEGKQKCSCYIRKQLEELKCGIVSVPPGPVEDGHTL